MAVSRKQLYLAGLAGVTMGANSTYTDSLLTFTELGGTQKQLVMTTGSKLVFKKAGGGEIGAVVLWPETSEAVAVTEPPPPAAMELDAPPDGLGAAPPTPTPTLEFKRCVFYSIISLKVKRYLALK